MKGEFNMPKFDDYTQKSTPEDTDLMLLLDKTENANKKVLFSGIWNWIVKKLAEAVIEKLQTSDKTIIGALNELNSKNARIEWYFSNQDDHIQFPAYAGAKYFIVLCRMGSTGSDVSDAIACVISTNYSVTSSSVSYINTIENIYISTEISNGNIIVKYIANNINQTYVAALVIRFR